MTHTDFNQLLSSLKGLTPEQVRQVREQLDRQGARSKPPTAVKAGKAPKRARPAAPQPKKPLTEEEFQQHLLKIGLVTSLPDPSLDIDDDDPDDAPVAIKGEPLSETILRERR